MLGTFLPWTPSGGPLLLLAMTGIENTDGTVTVVLGLVLFLIGGDALRRGGSSPIWAIGLAAALLTILTVARYFSRSWYGSIAESLPAYGLYVVMLGAIVGVVSSVRLSGERLGWFHPAERLSRQSGAAIATAGGLVVVGSLLPWAIGDVLSSGASVTGVEFVEGDLAFLMGAVIGVIGFLAWRSGGRSWTRLAVALLALVCLSIVAYGFATLAQRLEGWTWLSPGGGLVAVVVGGIVALVEAFRITSPEAVRVSPT